MADCRKPYTIMGANEIDIDNLGTIPDYFLGMREIEDESTGSTIITPVRVPGERVVPTGNLANVIALFTNNPDLNIPDNQVRAGYIDVQPGGNIMRYASSSNAPMFLMIKSIDNGKMLVQTTGFLTIPNGHQYNVAQQYYLGTNGEPVTDNTITGKKLFKPVDDYTLNINGDF